MTDHGPKFTPETLKKNALYLLQHAAALEGEEHFEEHQIEFKDGGWTIRHPIREAIFGTLFDCDVWWDDEDPGLRGVYVLFVSPDEGDLTIGPKVA